MISISQAADFIKANCLKDWDLNAIKHEIIKAINSNSLIYTEDGAGKLIGICVAHDDKKNKILHVKAIVARGLLRGYIWYFKERYEGYTLTAYRRNKFKQIKL